MKRKYVSPTIEIIPMETVKSVMSVSNPIEAPGMGAGGGFGKRPGTRAANPSFAEVEDFVNNVLTY
jgi:hypothetical protein